MNTLHLQRSDELLKLLKSRFLKNVHRHLNLEWTFVMTKLIANPEKLWSVNEMEITGGEPDVVGLDQDGSTLMIMDCVSESPKGRRSLCYDQEALESRKEFKPTSSALLMADQMGIELLTEEQYRYLQSLETIDLKTSSWIRTPPEIRIHGGALFCDRRYNHVFVYHNGAESYYAARGFRGLLRI